MKRLLITDLDNTLYDWVTFYAHAFSAMVDALVPLVGASREELLDDFREVHRRVGSSEHPWAALELACVRARWPDASSAAIKEKLDPALHAFNSARKKHLHLYDTVEATLAALADRGVLLVGHTEAIEVNAASRLNRLGILDRFRHLYVLEHVLSPHPLGIEPTFRAPPGKITTVPKRERKPNPTLLQDICSRESVAPRDAVYVGDSLVRDVSMAREAGVTAVWARYGTRYEPRFWHTVVRVTHWTDEEVAREAELRREHGLTKPDVTINEFAELLNLF
jgi:FMN phosphatase YigB (HAD superfamily)